MPDDLHGYPPQPAWARRVSDEQQIDGGTVEVVGRAVIAEVIAALRARTDFSTSDGEADACQGAAAFIEREFIEEPALEGERQCQ